MAYPFVVTIFINGKLLAHQPTVEQGRTLARNLRSAFEANCAAGILGSVPEIKLVPYRDEKSLT